MLLFSAALVPAVGAYYLRAVGSGGLLFRNHAVHEVAITVSLLCSAFVAYVAVRCYRSSGEVFVGWLALALIGETLVYAPHGVFTRLSHDHTALFLIYGPASRLVMSVLLLRGLIGYDQPAAVDHKDDRLRWWKSAAVFLLIDLMLAWASTRHADKMPILRLVLEYSALAATATALIMLLLRPRHSPLMRLYAFALVGFATSSVTFVYASPWTHLWWYAHAVFAAGFLMLGYGVLQAFHTTGSFSGVFSQEQLMEYLRAAKASAELTANQLKMANARLEVLARTDSLTGAVNRREFMERAEYELERAKRTHAPLSLMVLDLDHFKEINDRHGHDAGDIVLQRFVEMSIVHLRTVDIFGRIGGEEFAVLMPNTGIEEATAVAQRLVEAAREMHPSSAEGMPIDVSVSIGVACLGPDGDSIATLMRAADLRLYRAKQDGRDRVVAA
ncbi:GGDEF domain-containing protein [Sinimarinibacterium sp. CAU 1509]|uniref:GGDEF domain-containing protein n=1 Tax=Sinimarinibacterium sp. CAU 1509 TaxID=2562283 RepID=UPI00146C093D|nr:GGDEF domain-containing protein [Sinimarinibacterium sp. CAU 1509]